MQIVGEADPQTAQTQAQNPKFRHVGGLADQKGKGVQGNETMRVQNGLDQLNDTAALGTGLGGSLQRIAENKAHTQNGENDECDDGLFLPGFQENIPPVCAPLYQIRTQRKT